MKRSSCEDFTVDKVKSENSSHWIVLLDCLKTKNPTRLTETTVSCFYQPSVNIFFLILQFQPHFVHAENYVFSFSSWLATD